MLQCNIRLLAAGFHRSRAANRGLGSQGTVNRLDRFDKTSFFQTSAVFVFVSKAGFACSKSGNGHDTRAIQHYPGHKNIQHTVRYTELSAERFKGFWGIETLGPIFYIPNGGAERSEVGGKKWQQL